VSCQSKSVGIVIAGEARQLPTGASEIASFLAVTGQNKADTTLSEME